MFYENKKITVDIERKLNQKMDIFTYLQRHYLNEIPHRLEIIESFSIALHFAPYTHTQRSEAKKDRERNYPFQE